MRNNLERHESKTRLTGDDLFRMLLSATSLLEGNVETINSLNVFPVPDGDTGTNMFLTLSAVIDRSESTKGSTASEVADQMARGALMGARGNSGVILSQFFKGMAVGFDGASDFGASELASAYQEARVQAYKAVGEPVEGTMLTVISSVADAALKSLDSDGTIEHLCGAVCEAAIESVARTPTMLPVLMEAGVVDAGGQGFAVVLEGMRRSVLGEISDDLEVTPPDPLGVEVSRRLVSTDFLSSVDEMIYGYCTQFLINGSCLDVDDIRENLGGMAHSTVVVGDDTMVNVHVHTEDPGPVISFGVSNGTLSGIKIENMDDQHVEYSDARRKDADRDAEVVSTTVVVVASGGGLKKLFDSLGAAEIIDGGDTMNPSVQNLIQAIDRTRSQNVVILPNNSNIVSTAMQAAEISDKTVKVVPTVSIPQGISAILSFNRELDLDSNFGEMNEAHTLVKTAQTVVAVRSSEVDGVSVKSGQIVGLLEGKLVISGDNLLNVVLSLLGKAGIHGADLVTLYWGRSVTLDETNLVLDKLQGSFSEVEFELVEGGQPHYHFIISIE